MDNPILKNPHLEGDSFYWEGGPVGVLLLHGYTATTAEVRPLARFLHEQGYTVAGPLLPGHGLTPQALNRCRWQDWLRAAEAEYQRLAERCERVFVGGESMGGLLALFLASKYPEIAGVMAYAAALRLASPALRTLIPLIAPFVPVLEKKRAKTPSGADARWQGYQQDALRAGSQVIKLQDIIAARLHRITQPLLIIQGVHDNVVSADAPQMIYDGVRSAHKELHWFADSGHCVLIDREWEQVHALTLEFLRKTFEV